MYTDIKISLFNKINNSALDIFGGNGVTFQECVEWNEQHK